MSDTNKTILIVEDEEDIRLVYAEVLRDAGYRVIEANDGISGLARAKEGAWNLLLLDIMLPGKDGLEILKEIKTIDTLKEKPVILLTNLGNENIITQGFDLGSSGYLIKSEITPDKIIQEVEAYFEK
jgi:DNA-binding response OmpR family regulator